MSGPKIISDPLEVDDGIDLRMVELFFFAYRDFISDADEMLKEFGFGRAHHRVLHFVNRRPGLSVAELLEILHITKQSLGPVLRELMDGELLQQVASPDDGRKRLLYPTEKGRILSVDLTKRQSRRIHSALLSVASGERNTIEQFFFGMIEPKEQRLVEQLMSRPNGSENSSSS